MNVPSIQCFSPLPGSDAMYFLLSEIDNLGICPGNPEGAYIELGKAKEVPAIFVGVEECCGICRLKCLHSH